MLKMERKTRQDIDDSAAPPSVYAGEDPVNPVQEPSNNKV